MKVRAFVLDDDITIRDFVSSILEKRGYEVLSYPEPLSCHVYLDSKCPCPRQYACGDIFITDINMPGLTGLAFIDNQIRNGCKAIVLNKAVMSGAWTDSELDYARKLGCEVFRKPFESDQINTWLDQCEKRIDPNRKLVSLGKLLK